MKQLFRFLKLVVCENPVPAILACLTGAITVLCSAGLFGLSAYLIALTALQPGFEMVMVPVVGVRFFGISRAAFRYIERLISHDATFRILRDLRVSIYERLEPALPDLRQAVQRGGLVSRMVSDVENLQEAFLRVIYPYLTALAVLIAGFSILCFFNPLLGCAFGLIYFISVFAAPYLMKEAAKNVWAQASAVKEKMFGTYIELCYGLAEILSNQREDNWKTKIGHILKEDIREAEKVALHSAAANAVSLLLPGIAQWSCLIISCRLVSEGRLQGVLVAAAPLVCTALFEAVQPVFSAGSRIEKAAVSIDRLFDIRADSPQIKEMYKPMELQGREINISHLGFGYVEGKPVIKDFNLSLKRGQIKALMGVSGSGKSTLVNILLGFLKGYEGTVLIDGINIKELDEEKLRSIFSVVEQKPFFFNATIRENMKLANPHATDEDIICVLQKAEIHRFVAGLPDGLSTVMAELGSSVSGGELQRLAIARALLKDAPFFVFDEPTAGLDTINEKKIIKLLLELSREKGVLLVTHKRRMLEELDEIVRLAR